MNNRNEGSFAENLLKRLYDLEDELDYEILRAETLGSCDCNDPYFKELKIQKTCMEKVITAVKLAIKDSK